VRRLRRRKTLLLESGRMATINEEEFRKLCDRLFADRENVYALNPAMSRRDTLFWMLYGSLLSLLDIPADYEPAIPPEKSDNLYAAAILDILQGRMSTQFDAEKYLSELSRRVEEDAESP